MEPTINKTLECQKPSEVDKIIDLLDMTKDIPGDCLEAGIYRGDSAALILRLSEKTGKKLWLFDTFADFVIDSNDDPSLGGLFFPGDKGDVVYQEVKDRFKKNNVKVIRGSFPESGKIYLNKLRFSFAHLDMDVYTPTRKALEFLYPRMSVGGIILLHDYFHPLIKINEAVDNFMKNKPESVVTDKENSSQAYIIKQ